MPKANSTKVTGPKEFPSFAALGSPAAQAVIKAGAYDIWKLFFAVIQTFLYLRATGQHGLVDLSLLAILPDGTPAEFDLPDVTI